MLNIYQVFNADDDYTTYVDEPDDNYYNDDTSHGNADDDYSRQRK